MLSAAGCSALVKFIWHGLAANTKCHTLEHGKDEDEDKDKDKDKDRGTHLASGGTCEAGGGSQSSA